MMTQAKMRKSILVLWMAAYVQLCLGSWAGAQMIGHDPVELVRQLPPGQWSDDILQEVSSRLHWQIDQIDAWQSRLSRSIAQLEQEIEVGERKRNALQRQLGGAISRDDTLRRQLSERVLGGLFEARVERAATEALIKHLEKNLADVTPDQATEAVLAAERQSLQIELEGLMEKLKQDVMLSEQGRIMRSERSEIETKIQQLKLRIDAHNAQTKASKQRQAAERAAPLVEARGKLAQLIRRMEVCEEELLHLREAEQGAIELRRIDREIESLQTRFARRTQRLDEVNLNREEVSAFLNLIKNEAQKRAEEAKEDSKQSDAAS